jgi:hypothetical protein
VVVNCCCSLFIVVVTFVVAVVVCFVLVVIVSVVVLLLLVYAVTEEPQVSIFCCYCYLFCFFVVVVKGRSVVWAVGPRRSLRGLKLSGSKMEILIFCTTQLARKDPVATLNLFNSSLARSIGRPKFRWIKRRIRPCCGTMVPCDALVQGTAVCG